MFIGLRDRARTLVLTLALTPEALVAGGLWALGCAGPQTQTTPSVASSAAPAQTSANSSAANSPATNSPVTNSPVTAAPCAAQDGESAEQHQGMVHYSEAPRTMSVEAYQHVEFSLQTPERTLNLAPSQRVSWEDLKAARDRQVKLCCVWRAGATPSANEAAPMGPDGQPLARPSKCEVTVLTPIASK